MSRYLLDENLPATLAPLLGADCIHATDMAAQASDSDLWFAAQNEERVLLTKDTDFFERMLIEGPPPKLVWFRTGNLRRSELEQLVRRIWPAVQNLLNRCDLVEIHADKLEGLRFSHDLTP